MDVYLVRHGETDGNVARRQQHPETNLNEVGIKQAEEAAYEISKLKPTHIITSTQLRAVETTKIITAYCNNIIPDTHPAFEEIKRPNELIGSRYTSFTTMWYVWLWFIGKNVPDGEGYQDFINRIKEARNHLESLPDNARVVVVSHSVFINFFLEHLCSDKPMSFLRAVRRFWFVLTTRNASIIHLKHSDRGRGQCRWQFISASRVYPLS